ncbi:hypothetical protein AV540_25415 [Brevibacillus parabrevis]|uniref:N-acetylmuramoyl-L-alanine amidase n=1 Tax=Brevibacillus parabrevis TaxID=54914 RepID=UPI0007AB9C9E|nr:N-acetylmuramoyl-L-alanine amidase [Brevibacillus parabrevis]KZE42852.1 hypothetical protein AV540_25415 [Brevibacillus parabrevis]
MKRIIASTITALLLLAPLGQEAFAAERDIATIVLKNTNGSDELIKVSIPLKAESSIEKVEFALNELLSGKYEKRNVFSEIPRDTEIKNLELDGDKLVIDLNSEFVDNLTNNHNVGFILDSFLGTVFQFEEIQQVEFLVNGESIKNLDMYDFSIPFERMNDEEDEESKSKIVPLGADPGTNPVIVIDPGHGGKDPGAVASDGTTEAELNLKIARKLRDYLEDNLDATVYMTRNSDEYVDYSDRYNLANDENADLFISVHLNSVTNKSVKGTTVIYPNNHDISISKSAADFIHDRVTTVLYDYKAPYKDTRNLAVLRGTDVPAVLTETGFISNSSDLKYLKTSDGQDEVAYEIYRGIKNWWND